MAFARETMKERMCIPLLGVLLAMSTGVVFAADPVVSNVRASQRAGTKLVDIYYKVADADGNPQTVSVSATVAGAPIPCSTFLPGSHVGSGVTPGSSDKRIVWNAGADWNGQYSSAVRFTITADDGTSSGEYLVIDISAGPSASSYPVTYLTAVPAGGWTAEHKTTKLVMRRIPHGTFTMGSPTGELGRDSDETQHEVTLTKDFYIGVFEVTQKQWERVMGNWPSYFNNVTYRDSRPVQNVSYWEIRENPNRSDDPAVDWPTDKAVNTNSFMGRLRAKTGLATLDLPTEGQWEYACRAGTTTALNSGKNLTGPDPSSDPCPNMSDVGRYMFNGGSDGDNQPDCASSAGTATVGTYLANSWGLYDMHGNVREWCLDWYGTYPGAVTDPTGAASHPMSERVLRNGSWTRVATLGRAAFRTGEYPSNHGNEFGFRLARTMP
jgi:formylglycine-generating enzyme required for sulfatase activity